MASFGCIIRQKCERLIKSSLCTMRQTQLNSGMMNNFSSDATTKPPYVPRRALMYVPASDDKKLSKVSTLGADCVVLDCEDGVAVTRKEEARRNAAKFFTSDAHKSFKFEIGVRVNSASSGILAEDMKVLAEAKLVPPAIFLPKVDSVDDLKEFYELFKRNFYPAVKNPVNLIIWIESARALIDMPEILGAAKNLCKYSPLRADAVVFGSDDLCADIGATRSKEATELSYARQKFLLVCKAYRLQAIDLVFIDYKDLDGLRVQSEDAYRMGFTGKQVIHPTQVPVVQKAFLPSAETLQWAKELLEEFKQNEKSGKGAITFKGKMIDMPLVIQAQNIVDLVNKTLS